MKLKTRVWLIISASVLGMALVSAFSLIALRDTMLDERKIQIDRLLQLAAGMLDHYHKLETSGAMSRDEAQARAKAALGGLRSGDDYLILRSMEDVLLVHPDQNRIGKVDKGAKLPDGRHISDEYQAILAKADSGFAETMATRPGKKDGPKVAKLNGIRKFEPWGWMVGFGLFVDDIDDAFWARAVQFVLLSLAIIGVLATLSLTMSRKILQQLGGEPQYAHDIAVAISQGDLSQTVAISGSAGGNSMLGAVSRMQASLRDMVGRFNQASSTLAGASEQLSGRIGQIEQRSSETANTTAATAAAVEEMTVSIAHVADSTKAAEASSSSSAELARTGQKLASDAAAEIRHIADGVRAAVELVQGLDSRSKEIDRIAVVIKEIAEQTNLLALNAAIEAARAGEQGRGFAVVADEVRKLAERTGVATQNIFEVTGAVQNDTQSIAGRMGEVTGLVNGGVEQTERAAEYLQRISGSAEATLGQTRDVNLALSEQSQASESIARNVEHIAEMTAESDLSLREISKAFAELDVLAQELKHTASGFRV
ncbi:methyl-accepting chemotaxis protein [Chitinimonas prasina]|uniref:Methyl-accepting chemotaxis protein n=1 Tax=Chitinimonas prasina TaxID=1434937 RepID=A0ABQ5YDG1_9NEIS|nr:methyl-accepting chemotaxis protein [Chitinimonas prasina]GLR11622.1 methyl-accepting chemotaxis protein [Chitinimonas prasina]